MLGIFFLFFLSSAEAQLDISFRYSSYLTSTDLEGQLDHYMDMGLNFQDQDSWNSWFYKTEIKSLFSLDESNQNYITVPDLFIAYELSDILEGYDIHFVLGNQKGLNNIKREQKSKKNIENPEQSSSESWSFMDEAWHLGLWEGRINWDYLESESKGLTGVFWTVTKKKQWLLTVFLSGLFMPDQGPAVDITDGEIKSASRWFIPPQSEFVFFSQKISAFYWLKKPYLKNVVLNDSISVRFRFGDKDSEWLSLAYAYKPVNQIYFKMDGGFSIHKKAVDNVIHYQSFKHSLFSLDFGVKKNILNTVFSITQEIPLRPQTPKGWIVPVLPKALFFSSYMELDFGKYYWPIRWFKFNFLYSRFVDQKGAKPHNGEESLEWDVNINRFKMYRGFSISAQSKEFHWKKQAFSLGVRYWHSLPEEGGWLNTFFKWRVTPHWTFESKLDILGTNNNKINSFFNSYKHNDRIKVKVIYRIN